MRFTRKRFSGVMMVAMSASLGCVKNIAAKEPRNFTTAPSTVWVVNCVRELKACESLMSRLPSSPLTCES